MEHVQPQVAAALGLEVKQDETILSYANIENYLAQLEEVINAKCQISKGESAPHEIKEDFTRYSRPAPNIGGDDLKDKND